MVLLVIILLCCISGVTVLRGQSANEHIFGAIWFNGLLVLLVLNVACCFFGRIWGRRVTIISFGMILFHLSFVTLFLGVVYNSLFYFRGNIRLTEGESLPNNDPQSYDVRNHGMFFRYSRLKGETTLVRMHAGYKVDGKDKRVAYEVEVGEGSARKHEIIYVTRYLEYGGTKYFRDREGYSLLLVLTDKQGNDLYGAYIPLQSYKQNDETFRYATGTKEFTAGMPFPQKPQTPMFNLLTVYNPSKFAERSGDVEFTVRSRGSEQSDVVLAQGRTAVGSLFDLGAVQLSPREVRYWVAMQVTYEPGQPLVLYSLWAGLVGVSMTTLGRIFRKR